MFSDWTIADRVNSLGEYSTTLYNDQAAAHGSDYMLVHEEIKKHLVDCESYTELGVNQGATLVTAMLEGIKKIRAYDIKLAAYNPAKKFFESYAKDNNVDYAIFEANTLKCKIEEADLFYIDTVHRYHHLTQELLRHGHKAQKYIVFHDTEINQGKPGLRVAVQEYVAKNSEWKIITDCKIDVGFMTIKRN